ncbi:FluG domain-containing protein [Podospora didyma]|uniref:FluG domain-containing protein n=1 Tax=Podospora didyma TaxID=330526 RepID=A0AAE0N6D7_9PEZI|nr:FluG domain-containing protein [Podospora didyma]
MPARTEAVRHHTARNGVLGHHADFLKRVADRETNARVSKQPPPLSVKQHAAHRKKMTGVRFIKPKYAAETQINVSGIYGKWKRYCTDMEVGEWETILKKVNIATMEDFFLWVCEKHKIRSWGTSLEYIRQFQQLYTTVTGQYTDRNNNKELYKYHDRVLIPRFGLRAPNIDGKPVLNVDALRVILTFNIAYDTGVVPLERQRVNQAGCDMIICYAGVRPAELVNNERKPPKDGSLDELFGAKAVMSAEAQSDNEGTEDNVATDEDMKVVETLLLQETVGRDRQKALCYEDILMMIVRHPATGQATLAMSIKFVHHKGCDNKPRPTIFFFTPSKKLIFCPILLFLALALSDHAFEAKCIDDARSVLAAQVPGGLLCVPLRWKESMLKIPFFRRVSRDGALSENEAMLYATLRDHMARQSLEAGFGVAWTPKAGRRGAANAANGNAPDAVRDQMMRHNPKFFTFFSAYLNQIANFHLQNAFLEEELENQLFRMFAHVSLTRDPRATRDMVPEEVWASLPPDPEISKLEERRAELKQGQYRFDGHKDEDEIRELTYKIRLKLSQREKRIVKEYREYYFYHRPTWDLERQAEGGEVEQYEELAIDLVIPERARLAEIFCHQPDDLGDKEMAQLRIEVINLYVALCGKRETVKRKRAQRTAPAKLPTSGFIKLEADPDIEFKPAPGPFPLLTHPNQCPGCIGDERMSLKERTFRYCRPTKRNDHFDDNHLEAKERAEQLGQLIIYNDKRCKDMTLYTVDHFRNHVQSVHTITLRTSEQVQERRARKLKLRRSRQSG